MFKKGKKKGKLFGVTKSGKAKPIKALTGIEIALISGALTAGASALMAPKVKGTTSVDPFKKITNTNPQEFISNATNASKTVNDSLDPVTSQGESMAKDTAQKAVGTDNADEEAVTMRRGGSVRGVRIAQRGFKKIRVL
jgi:hypothetical protein